MNELQIDAILSLLSWGHHVSVIFQHDGFIAIYRDMEIGG